MAKGAGGLLDLETHFAFYGAYHSNPVNILIHMLFVWPILFSTLMLFHYTPSLIDVSLKDYGLVINMGFFVTVIYALFYVLLDRKLGTLAVFLCFGCWVGASFLCAQLGYSLP